MKLWPGPSLSTAFILMSCSISSSYPPSRVWDLCIGGRGAILGSRETRRIIKRKGETTGFEDRPEASAEISSELGEKVRRPFLFHPLLEHPRSWPQIALQRSFIASEIGVSLPIFGACPSPDPSSIHRFMLNGGLVCCLISAARLFISPLTGSATSLLRRCRKKKRLRHFNCFILRVVNRDVDWFFIYFK
ncbi:hypothetical protein B0T18DRAFT_212034 [Schizothecium vesticola]|uniref:Secreted protein n=1 Tax=Schizothecium vesticola TaxID=314040 RepID=A0AA40EJM9_9PEZI|nr:hypothetical protein B0T18DRAFT_212034 [Schizothecium vesticola]